MRHGKEVRTGKEVTAGKEVATGKERPEKSVWGRSHAMEKN
jgi:hypothetical protein